MTFTVVRAVRGVESTAGPDPVEKLRRSIGIDAPARAAAMDLPFAEAVIRLDFVSNDFPKTVPGGLRVLD
jgi:hypothetical protein